MVNAELVIPASKFRRVQYLKLLYLKAISSVSISLSVLSAGFKILLIKKDDLQILSESVEEPLLPKYPTGKKAKNTMLISPVFCLKRPPSGWNEYIIFDLK